MSASTRTVSVLRWTMRTGVRLALPSLYRPDEGAVRAPLDRQRIDGRIGVAGKAHRDLERHAGPQRVVGVVDAGLHEQRPARLVEPVVDRADAPSKTSVRPGDRRRSQRPPTAIALAKRSGTQKSTMMLERSSIVAIAVSRGDVVAGLDRQDADDAGDRRDDRAAFEREFGVAQRQARIVQRPARRRSPARAWQRWNCAATLTRASLRFSVVERDLGAVERDLLGLGVEPGDDRCPLRRACPESPSISVSRPEV